MNDEMLKQIAASYDTPAYVFDLSALKERVQMLQNELKGVADLCYAMKANPFLIGALDEDLQRFEVCSPGEFQICERTGISMEKIVLSGVYKNKADMERVIKSYKGQGVFTIESENHLELLQECAGEEGVLLNVLIRVTSGNQFGLDEESVSCIIGRRSTYPNLNIRGLQYYSGTQKKKLGKSREELEHLDLFITDLKEQFGFAVQELEFGPGLYVPYFEQETDYEDQEMLAQLREMLKGMQFKGNVTLEMGRYIAAQCGDYITKIVDQKRNAGQNYCIVDGGIHHLNYYGQMMAMKIPKHTHIPMTAGGETENWNICGSLCTVSDVLVKQLPLQNAKEGDILVFHQVGAYSVTEGIYLFLSRDLPQIIFYSTEKGMELIRKTTETNKINSVN